MADEPTYLIEDSLGPREALRRSQAALVETRRRWPAVRRAAQSLQNMVPDHDRATPTPPAVPAPGKARPA